MSDPAKYRTKEELEEYRNQDPILMLKADMMQANWLKEEEFKAIDQRCKQAADEAVRFSEDSPEPAPEALYEDILA
jgi:pyruvate dehydrogenase E1 component alpha subunit